MKADRTMIMILLISLVGCNTLGNEESSTPNQLALSNNHIRIDQFGYRPADQKIAVIASPQEGFNSPDDYGPSPALELRDGQTGQVVFTGPVTPFNEGRVHEQSGDRIWWFDFSEVDEPGEYIIYDRVNDESSYPFHIGEDVYNEVLKQAVRVFFYQRSGFTKEKMYAGPWNDGASHSQDQYCRPIGDKTNASQERDLSGGWYDAGDYNKYVNYAFSAVHDLLSAYRENPDAFTDDYNIPESGNGIPDLLDEVKWEMDWLLKMQEADGSVLFKVSVENYQSASPPSEDTARRYYAPAQASSTSSFSGMMAHGYLIYRDIPFMAGYAQDLLAAGEQAWSYLEERDYPLSHYDSEGFSNTAYEPSDKSQRAVYITSAIYLYAATGKEEYRRFVEENYRTYLAQPFTWWNAYDSIYQDALLFYAALHDVSPEVREDIQSSCVYRVSGSSHLLGAVINRTDGYRAYMTDGDYGWGNNREKSHTGLIFYNMIHYALDSENHGLYSSAAQDYLHYLHGVNAVDLVMLSNMYDYGGDRCVNEIYHSWFGDGTEYDNALTSPMGPAPGYITGGVNSRYSPDGSYSGPALKPPLNQPVQKWYRDWNSSYPENSWEITEPAIGYQAAYVKLLSKFVQ